LPNKATEKAPGGSHEPLNAFGRSCDPLEDRGHGARRRRRDRGFCNYCAHLVRLQPERPGGQGWKADRGYEFGSSSGSLSLRISRSHPSPQGWVQWSHLSPKGGANEAALPPRGGFSFCWSKNRLSSTSYRWPANPGTVAVSVVASSIEIAVCLSSRQDVPPGDLQPWGDYNESLMVVVTRLLLWGFPARGESACNWQCWNDGHRGPHRRARTDLRSMDQSQSRPVRQSMPAGRICDRCRLQRAHE
jgi:hypothetical protein